jgi:metallophosphoesterase (TIGR03767 family)
MADPVDPRGMTRALTTLERTIAPGDVLRTGTLGSYRCLATVGGEQHVRRLDLAPDTAPAAEHRSILHLLHLTDTQIVDVQSPARFEFLDRHADRGAIADLLPMYRPHESLQLHALEAMIRTARSLPSSPITGEPVSLAVSTGDAIDNQQWNELVWFLGVMRGGTIAADSGRPGYEGVQASSWDDPEYWRPDGPADVYAERWGFPTYPGLMTEATERFDAVGLGMPWLACLGNHEGLVQGTSLPTQAVRAIAVGDRKAIAAPSDLDLERNVDRFVHEPEAFLAGPSRAVAPDPDRRLFTRTAFVQAHLGAEGSPRGHGFTPENLERGTAYYVYDAVPGVRLVVLDTANPGGSYDGSIGARQAAWLEERLTEVHGSYTDRAGDLVHTGNEDRLVVVFSHHGLETLTNDLAFSSPFESGAEDFPRVLGPALREMLHRFANVVLWVSGHTHEHHAIARPDPQGRTAGFWEVSTGAIADWPVQSRVIELVDNGNGTLSVFTTLVDHSAPTDPTDAEGLWRLASIHRELAANDPHRGMGSVAAGEPSDRNVELVLPSPYALS